MKITIPLKTFSWNEIINHNRINKFAGASIKKKEMQDLSFYLRNVPKIEKYPIEITFTWHLKNPRCDLDNMSEKSTLDCLQNLGILENDNIKHINKITHIAVLDKEDFFELEIN